MVNVNSAVVAPALVEADNSKVVVLVTELTVAPTGIFVPLTAIPTSTPVVSPEVIVGSAL